MELRPKRDRCPDCDGATTTQPLSWYQPRSLHTNAYEQWLMRMLIHSTVRDRSRKLEVRNENLIKSRICGLGILPGLKQPGRLFHCSTLLNPYSLVKPVLPGY